MEEHSNRLAVSVVIPAFNEESAIEAQIAEVRDALDATDYEFEVLVVDDGSDDSTGGRAAAAGARVVRHAENRGYGASLKTGIDLARFESIVMIDADGTYPAKQIPELLAALPEADMVVAARTGAEVHVPWVRRPAKWVLRWLATRIAGRKIPDLNSGLRAFRRESVRQYFSILPDQFSWTTTITLALLADGYRILYQPINYYRRVGESKIRPWHFMDFTMLVLRVAMLFQPLRIFVPLAFLFGTVGVLKVLLDVIAFIPRNESFGASLLYEAVLSSSALFLLLMAAQLLLVGMVADGVLRRIMQRSEPQVRSRAVVLEPLDSGAIQNAPDETIETEPVALAQQSDITDP
jgi:glycosyltransferase involved in cell wall biosynthesis